MASGHFGCYKKERARAENSDDGPSGQPLSRDWARVGVCHVPELEKVYIPSEERRSSPCCPSGPRLAEDWTRVGLCQVSEFGKVRSTIGERRSSRKNSRASTPVHM